MQAQRIPSLDRDQAQHMRRILWKWGNTPYFIRRKEEEIRQFQDAIQDAYETLGAQRITDMPRCGGLAQSSVERAIEAAEHRIEQFGAALHAIQEEIDQALALKTEIDKLIWDMDAIAQKVLVMRYVDDHQWTYIGLKLNYDDQHVRRIERDALTQLARFCTFF